MSQESPDRVRLVTCIVAKGKAADLQQQLIERWQLHSTGIHYARGVGRTGPVRSRGIGEQTEKEVLEVILPEELADEVFEFLYLRAGFDRQAGGMIYVSRPERSSRFVLPVLDAAGRPDDPPRA